MLSFSYTARDPSTGQKIKAEVQADNEQAAAKLLTSQGLSPLEITLNEGSSGFGKYLHRIKSKDKVLFSRQLSTLINAGLPLIQSLRSVAKQTQNKSFQVVINHVISDVEGGSSFSAALGRYPLVFNRVYISLTAAGEASGTLDAALERIANQQEKDAEILSKVRGALVYPVIVLIVMFAVIGFMIVKVLPQVEILYKGLPGHNSLPLITRVLLALSHFIIRRWVFVIIALVLITFITSRWARTFGGRRAIDKIKMRAWPVGPLFMKVYMARFARTGTTLVASGVPLIQMLEITGDAIDNIHIENSLRGAIEKVKGGKALSDSIQGDPNFLELVPDMLRIGEQSGSMEQMLGKTADYYEKEVDNQIKTISTIIEPLLMVILGVFAFIVVAAVLLPIYGLAGKAGFGG
ncbi:MAG TPA: type II secretion system F family protein [Candidatus Saccharimonadales bacterium]|nr:type II secretion system F family protein [Candidatus Saccharimonadales bacterium]